jgi:urease accessory protein
MNELAFLRLLQLNDTQFPIGSFAYSNGLETYAQQGLKRSDLEAYLKTQLEYGWGRLDLAALALSYTATHPQDLCDDLTAWKVIPSVCQSSIKLGQRLLNLSKRLYSQLEISLSEPHQAVVMGLLGKSFEVDRSWLMLAYAQSTLTNTLVMATRCMSLSPEQAQEILVRLQPVLVTVVQEVLDNPQAFLYAATPASDIRAHQQAYLYTRLFQS